MDIEKDIIQDQKETIHRLQEECKEKTDIIMALGQENEELKTVHKQLKQMIKSKESLLEKAIQENAELKKYEYYYLDKFIDLKQALEEIRDMFPNQVAWCGQLTPFEEKIYKIINEVLGNE